MILSFTSAGFYFIPGALRIEEQCHWIVESLMNFPQPPNRTNHNAVYGPIQDLFAAAKERRRLLVGNVQLPKDTSLKNSSEQADQSAAFWRSSEESDEISGGDKCKSVLASVLLRKLRWSTLGLQFDWSKVFFLYILSSRRLLFTVLHIRCTSHSTVRLSLMQ